MAETFDAIIQFDERAEVGKARHAARHDITWLVLVEETIPGVRLQVFDR